MQQPKVVLEKRKIFSARISLMLQLTLTFRVKSIPRLVISQATLLRLKKVIEVPPDGRYYRRWRTFWWIRSRKEWITCVISLVSPSLSPSLPIQKEGIFACSKRTETTMVITTREEKRKRQYRIIHCLACTHISLLLHRYSSPSFLSDNRVLSPSLMSSIPCQRIVVMKRSSIIPLIVFPTCLLRHLPSLSPFPGFNMWAPHTIGDYGETLSFLSLREKVKENIKDRKRE